MHVQNEMNIFVPDTSLVRSVTGISVEGVGGVCSKVSTVRGAEGVA